MVTVQKPVALVLLLVCSSAFIGYEQPVQTSLLPSLYSPAQNTINIAITFSLFKLQMDNILHVFSKHVQSYCVCIHKK